MTSNRCPDCGGGLWGCHCVVCNTSFRECIACWHKFPRQVCTHVDHGGKYQKDDDLDYLIPVKRTSYWTGGDVIREIERRGCVFVRHVSQGLDDYKNPKTDRHCLVSIYGDMTDDTANNIFRVLGDPTPVYTKPPRYRCTFCNKWGISKHELIKYKGKILCPSCLHDLEKIVED